MPLWLTVQHPPTRQGGAFVQAIGLPLALLLGRSAVVFER